MPQSGYSTAYSSLNPLLCKGELKTKHVLDIILYFYSKRTNCVYSCNQSAVFVTFNTMKTESCPSMQLPYIKTRDQHFLTHVYVHGSRISDLKVTRHVTARSPESLLPFCFLQRKLLANVHHHSVWHALLNACSVTETTGWASLSLIIFTQAPVTYTKLRENETYSQTDDFKTSPVQSVFFRHISSQATATLSL